MMSSDDKDQAAQFEKFKKEALNGNPKGSLIKINENIQEFQLITEWEYFMKRERVVKKIWRKLFLITLIPQRRTIMQVFNFMKTVFNRFQLLDKQAIVTIMESGLKRTQTKQKNIIPRLLLKGISIVLYKIISSDFNPLIKKPLIAVGV